MGAQRDSASAFIDFKKAYDSLEVLYNILIEFGISMKLVRLIKMCLNETIVKSVEVNICMICKI
jgi:hypothetical protein